MSYNPKGGHGYGNQSKHGGGFGRSFSGGKRKNIGFSQPSVSTFNLPPKAFIRRVLIQQLVKERGYAEVLASLQQIQTIPEYQDSPERTAKYQSDLAWLQRHEADITSDAALQDVSENIP